MKLAMGFGLSLSLFLLLFYTSPAAVSVSALSFNLTSFDPSDSNIVYDRAAYAARGVIYLTGETASQATSGHATYFQALHLWDKASGNLTDFLTHFAFAIDSQNASEYGDGLAFFFAPENTKMDTNMTAGAGFGLIDTDQTRNSTDRPLFAVEFDVYINDWDPPYRHVGIDINSIESLAVSRWNSSVMDGRRSEAWIVYDSDSRNLSVTFTDFSGNSTVLTSFSHVIDLRKYLPERVTMGFSASTGYRSELHRIYSWDFSSSTIVFPNLTANVTPNGTTTGTPSEGNDGKPHVFPNSTVTPNGTTTGTPSDGNDGKLGLAVGLSVGGLFLAGCLGLVWLWIWKKKRRGEGEDEGFDEFMDPEIEMGNGPKRFSYSELARATHNFSVSEKLGQGGFGEVYKGFLEDLNAYVAVKRVSKGSRQGIKEYASEIRVISRLRHRNLVQLIGWCHEKKELLLVYELMSNASLDAHLFKENSSLAWGFRYKIAQEIASALLYLHEEWEQCVVHRDIKSSNVMLDSRFNAKLGDFGLARMVDHEKGFQTTVVAGTLGYMAPECAITGRASKESDVFSFGIVALEIACGRKPINPKAKLDEIVMVEWVWMLYGEGNILGASDPKLSRDFDSRQMECLMIVGLWCAHPDINSRPAIRQAIQVLNFEAPLPSLPPKMPVPNYLSPPAKQVSSFSLTANDSKVENGKTQNPNYNYSTHSSEATTSSSAALHSPTATLLHTR